MLEKKLQLSMLSHLKPEEIDDDLLRAAWAYEDCSNLFHFSRNTLGFAKLTAKPHADLCDFVTNQGKYEGRLSNKWKLILLPRGTYKTTVASQAYPLWLLLRDPNTRILLDSETYAKSVVTLRSIKGLLATNERLRGIHGDLTQPCSDQARAFCKQAARLPWNEDEIILGSRTNFALKEPSIAVGGLDIVRVGMHYDVVIADDLHSEKNVTTKEQIDKVIAHIQLMTSILDPGAQFVIIGTRWDDRDAYGWIIDEVESLALKQPGVYRGKTFDIMVYPWKWGTEDQPVLFAPEILNDESIRNIKKIYSPYLFSCQYMNDPVDQETAIFKKEWIEKNVLSSARANLMFSDGMSIFTSIDPAVSENKNTDYSAIVTVGFCNTVDRDEGTVDLQRVLLDVHYGHWNPDQLVEEVINVARKYRPLKIGFESVGAFDAYQSIFRERCRVRGFHLPIEFFKRDTRISKETRIGALSPIFRAGSYYYVRGARGVQEFLDEYKRYPKGKHDDVLDALADIERFSYFPVPSGAGVGGGPEYKPLDEISGY